MSSLAEKISRLKQDALFGRVLRNSAHLLSTNSVSLALSFLMGILSARLLGVQGFGLVGLVMGYASTVNSILSFRMSELVVRYGGEYLETGAKDRAGALVKASALAEATVSVLAFLFVVLDRRWIDRRTPPDEPEAARAWQGVVEVYARMPGRAEWIPAGWAIRGPPDPIASSKI